MFCLSSNTTVFSLRCLQPSLRDINGYVFLGGLLNQSSAAGQRFFRRCLPLNQRSPPESVPAAQKGIIVKIDVTIHVYFLIAVVADFVEIMGIQKEYA